MFSAQLRYVSCHALVDCCILSDYKTVKESEAAFCEHHAIFVANTFSPQIGSAVDNQSNKKSTTIPVAEHQDYTTTLVELTTGLWPVHAATYTGRNGIITELFVRGNLTADAPKASQRHIGHRHREQFCLQFYAAFMQDKNFALCGLYASVMGLFYARKKYFM